MNALRVISAGAALLVATATLAGCGGKSLGATTNCQTYRGLSASDKDKAVTNMEASHGDHSAVGVVRLSVAGYCLLHPSSQIQGIYGG